MIKIMLAKHAIMWACRVIKKNDHLKEFQVCFRVKDIVNLYLYGAKFKPWIYEANERISKGLALPKKPKEFFERNWGESEEYEGILIHRELTT
jgi:hypothetical protein